MKSESFVSVVLLTADGLASLESSVRRVQDVLASTYTDYEVVVIGLGPSCEKAAAEDAILREVPCVRFVQLSAAVHDDVAWAAGVECAIGDFVILFDPRIDPVTEIPHLVERCRAGADVVIGTAARGSSAGYSILRLLSTRVLRAIDYDLPKNATTLRCLSRRAVNAVTRTGRFHHQFFLRIQKTGYPSVAFPYEPVGALGARGVWAGARDLIRLMVFNSSRPLRWMSFIGFGGSVVAFGFAAYSVLIHLVSGSVVQGWTTTILFMSVLFMTQFVMMAFFGEYLGRLLDDRSEQSDYSVVFEKNSSVMVDADRVNVLGTSTAREENMVQTARNG